MSVPETSTEAVLGTLGDLRRDGRLIGKLGGLPVLVVWSEGRAFAIENRCPHLGFPLHQGTVEAGLITCHWHHARFDLASGGTLDPWADDALAFEVRLAGHLGDTPGPVEPLPDDTPVVVAARPGGPATERWANRLAEGLEHGLTLVIAKSVPALLELPDGERTVLRVAYEFGDRNRAAGWGSGMTVLTCVANLLPHLADADRALALVHGLTFLARDVSGSPPRFALGPLAAVGQPPERVLGWYRRFVDTRDSDGAERALATALAAGAVSETEATMFGALTDHIYVDGGHALDFTNKAFEALVHVGPEGSGLLAGLVAQTAAAERSEESSEWNHPRDLVALATSASAELQAVLEARQASPDIVTAGARADPGRLAWALLATEPDDVLAALVGAARDGLVLEELARAVALAAGLRLARFHLNNDPGDWDTVHHTFTFANAVHQAIVRQPTVELGRGVVHGALRVYLDRFLNVPAARLPTADRGSLAQLAGAWNTQGAVDVAADGVWGFLHSGGSRADLIAALGRALLQEDAGFHGYQNLEAGIRQALAWPDGSVESALLLVGAARFLAAHTPTRRELAIIARTAVRLRRGEELFAED